MKKTVRKSPQQTGEMVIFITAPTVEEGQKIAHCLVSEHLVACVNIVSPVQSIFYWQEKVCDEKEALLICKTRSLFFEKITNRVKELHSYSVPEVIALPVIEGSADYLRWVREVTRAR